MHIYGKICSLFSHTRIKKNKIYVCLDWLFPFFLCENKLTHFLNYFYNLINIKFSVLFFFYFYFIPLLLVETINVVFCHLTIYIYAVMFTQALCKAKAIRKWFFVSFVYFTLIFSLSLSLLSI